MSQTADLGAGLNVRGPTTMVFYAPAFRHVFEVADAAFSVPTLCGRHSVGRRVGDLADAVLVPTAEAFTFEPPEQTEHAGRTEPVSLQDPEREVSRGESPELAAVEDLRRWLNVSYADVARIAGWRSPSIIFYWKKRRRDGGVPRPRANTVERLYRAHSVLKALAEAIEGEQGVQAVQLWSRRLDAAGTAPLELLLEGRLEEVYQQARPLLFDVSVQKRPITRTLLIEEEPAAVEARAPRPKFAAADFE